MLILLLAYLGGVLTILSPCILPVLPFVFARGDKPFLPALPLLIGMAVTFAGVASLAAVGGGGASGQPDGAVGRASPCSRCSGCCCCFRASRNGRCGHWSSLDRGLASEAASGGSRSSVLLGAATGLLWAPCAGPILGIILTAAAVGREHTTFSSCLPMRLAPPQPGAGAAHWRRSLRDEAVDRGGRAGSASAWPANLDRRRDDRARPRHQGSRPVDGADRFGFEPGRALGGARWADDMPRPTPGPADLPDEGTCLRSMASAWLNGRPLTREQLKGKVVLIDFWTYSCINCIRAIPHIRALQERYRQGRAGDRRVSTRPSSRSSASPRTSPGRSASRK